MTEPTLEEMKKAVLKWMPLGVISTEYGYSSFWPYGIRPHTSVRFFDQDGLSGEHRAWQNAYYELPPQPAPESEDEAFERWWCNEYRSYAELIAQPICEDDYEQGIESVRSEAHRSKEKSRKAWNARARLSAGGK